jgi:hypothetical protein
MWTFHSEAAFSISFFRMGVMMKRMAVDVEIVICNGQN